MTDVYEKFRRNSLQEMKDQTHEIIKSRSNDDWESKFTKAQLRVTSV